MQYNHEEKCNYLKESEFEELFTQVLGWDNHTQTLTVVVEETTYTLTAIAHKRGMVVFECPQSEDQQSIPDYATRRKIQKQVAKSSHENFVIYTNIDRTTQIWQWVKRQQGKPDACREHKYENWQSGESLRQKLHSIAFTLNEEGELFLTDVSGRVQGGFDVERVTKKFYDHFKREHGAFLEFLTGIPNGDMQKWYVSVMLNRLMFIYFIQKKEFLNNDINYLRNKLIEMQETGTDKYYKEFLCPLFFEGFAKPETDRTSEMKQILGKIPYLNGGIFQKHQLETLHDKTIEIPDIAFEKLFTFFERYQWHLDERPLRNDNEINPDVLGYIFEKYINQKQMGAYYTKEDITEYISKNTIIPFLFDAARKECKIAFEGDASVWKLLQEDPDRYIYNAVRKGVKLDLPEEIAVGIEDVSKRTEWNTPAPVDFALPTEIWREVVARRQRYETIKTKIKNEEIDNINDLITYNLNIRQFAQDVIENCEGPELLRAFWKAITKVTVLDPTCGSGAFLFAALNILEPLYEACLDRMQVFLDELQTASAKPHPKKYSDFHNELDKIKQHPNREYFVLKSIIINNLYGVDIMDEAVEICKLRLFLKMVAQIDKIEDIEPLPDIDFNIQAGNTLVGFATEEELRNAIYDGFDFDNIMERVTEKAKDIKVLFKHFRDQQTEYGGEITPEHKHVLQEELRTLNKELNQYLAGKYDIDLNNDLNYKNWLKSHKPFHWYIAFYEILQDGGFDVIIGNPPYVKYNKVKEDYTVKEFKTEKCGNLYAFMFERCLQLLRKDGWNSMIIPITSYSADITKPLQQLFHENRRVGWVQTYGIRPAKLFIGADQRLSIYILQQGSSTSSKLYTTCYNRWNGKFRSHLFDCLNNCDVANMTFQNSIPKINSRIQNEIWDKMSHFTNLNQDLSIRATPYTIYFHSSPRYWIRAMNFIPYYWNEQNGKEISGTIKPLYLNSDLDATVVVSSINSSLFYQRFILLSDCRSLKYREIRNYPIGVYQMDDALKQELSRLSLTLMNDYKHHSQRMEINKKNIGKVIYDAFFPKHSKPLIDEIDRVLAKHYGFTDEELDFIINYDIKYRMGLGN